MHRVNLFISLLLCLYVISCTEVTNNQEESQLQSYSSTKEMIQAWKENPPAKRLEAFTFKQETIRFADGSARDTGLWHEIIAFPNSFRIDLGSKGEGNTNIYRNDSVYVMRKGQLVHSGRKVQEFMITEGALYDFSVDSTLSLLKEVGIDHTIFDTVRYKNRPCYIVGAKNKDLSKAQIWLDREHRHVLRRFMNLPDDELMEVRFDKFENIDGFQIETWLEFFVNDTLIQTEKYFDIKVNPAYNEKVFDPKGFSSNYWW